jgi:hypothetical protein
MTIEGLDPGICRTVVLLRQYGFDTTDSGDGKSKPPEPGEVLTYPHVFMVVSDPRVLVAEADRLALILGDHGVKIGPMGPEARMPPCIQAAYCPANKSASLMLMGVDDRDIKPDNLHAKAAEKYARTADLAKLAADALAVRAEDLVPAVGSHFRCPACLADVYVAPTHESPMCACGHFPMVAVNGHETARGAS